MKQKFLLKITVFITICCFAISAFAAFDENKARRFVEQTGNEVIEALNAEDNDVKCAILDELFEVKFDVPHMARFALGRYAKLFDDEQKKRYEALFKRYVKSLYKIYVLDFDASDVALETVDIRADEKYVKVTASILLPEEYRTENMDAVRLDFKLKEQNQSYIISDVSIGDMSLLLMLRSRFAEKIREDEEEPEWFLESLEDLVLSNEYNVEQMKE